MIKYSDDFVPDENLTNGPININQTFEQPEKAFDRRELRKQLEMGSLVDEYKMFGLGNKRI